VVLVVGLVEHDNFRAGNILFCLEVADELNFFNNFLDAMGFYYGGCLFTVRVVHFGRLLIVGYSSLLTIQARFDVIFFPGRLSKKIQPYH